MTRGYAAIALFNPKTPANIGGAIRAAGCYGADLVVVGGTRRICNYANLCTDTMKDYRKLPVITQEDVIGACPVGAIPVAVELLREAQSLVTFDHPERGYYIFGPEDGSVPEAVRKSCKWTVFVPTRACMNLAATVNVVLYDRLCKRSER